MKKRINLPGGRVNWGTGIVIAFAVFMSLTMATVICMMNQDVNLVADDYYEQEIKYQQQIDRIERTNRLDKEDIISFDGSIVNIELPSELRHKKVEGEIYFYRPSDSSQDFKIPFNYRNETEIVFPVDELSNGYWRVQLHWEIDGEKYYTEKKIFIK